MKFLKKLKIAEMGFRFFVISDIYFGENED